MKEFVKDMTLDELKSELEVTLKKIKQGQEKEQDVIDLQEYLFDLENEIKSYDYIERIKI
jgi:cob(I)alamin adenosyltransferase